MSDSNADVTDSVLWATLRRFWWVVLGAALLTALVAVFALNSKEPQYESEARLLIGPLTGSTDSLRASASLGLTYQDALRSRAVLERVASQVGVEGPTEAQLADLSNVGFNDKSRILTVHGLSAEPSVSLEVARLLVSEVARLQAQVPDTEVVEGATSDVAQQERNRQASGKVTEIQPASLSSEPVGQNQALLVGMAALLGGSIAFAGSVFYTVRRDDQHEPIPPQLAQTVTR